MSEDRIALIQSLGFEDLERCRNLSRNTRDPERWTALQWLQLYACFKAATHDISPDEWTGEQVAKALTRGIVPTFTEEQD